MSDGYSERYGADGFPSGTDYSRSSGQSHYEGESSFEQSGISSSDTRSNALTQSHSSTDQFSESESHGFGLSETKGQGQRRGTSRAQGANWNDSEAETWNDTEGENQSISKKRTLLNEYETREEPGAHYSLEEQKYKINSMLERLPPQFAAIRIDHHDAEFVYIRNVIGADEIDVSAFEKQMFDEHNTSRPYFLPRAEAQQEIERHEARLYASPKEEHGFGSKTKDDDLSNIFSGI